MSVASATSTSSPRVQRSAEIALGIRAARTLAMIKQAQEGGHLTDQDRAELETMKNAFLHAADAAGRVSVTPTSRRSIASVGLTLSTIAADVPDNDPAAISLMLRERAQELASIVDGQAPVESSGLTSLLEALVRAADRATARKGETLVSAQD